MGQKANPLALRLGINKDWISRWFAPDQKTWATWLVQDKKIRNYFNSNIKLWALSSIEIDRTTSEIKIIVNTAKPGIVLGQDGSNIAVITKEISKIIKKRETKIEIVVKEIPNPDLDAIIVANEIALALENRASFRMAQKRVIQRVMRSGAKGIKTQVSGRLNGVDMARTEGYSEGIVPQQTFRNDLDYALALAHTTYGVFGVKVWISRGELLKGQERKEFVKPERFERKPNTRNTKDNRDSRMPDEKIIAPITRPIEAKVEGSNE